MADLDNVTAEWVSGIYQLETTDPVLGGPPNPSTGDGIDNIPHFQLAQRTQWLRTELLNRTAASALLATIKGVDGPGSGLDADLLDGQHANYFARAADLASLTSDAAIIAAVKRQDGAGSGVDADTVDGKHASGFLEKSGGTISGSLDINGSLDVEGEIESTDGNIRATVGWFYQQGVRMCSQRSDFGITATAFARKSGGGESFYGDTISGSNLQVCAADGSNNNGNIGVGTWQCQGYSAAASAGAAKSATQWTRIL